MRIILLAVVLMAVSGSLSQAAEPSLNKLCGQEFNSVPRVTPQRDGSIYLCTTLPTAFQTAEDGILAASGFNDEAAASNCEAGYEQVSRKDVVRYFKLAKVSVSVITQIKCK